MIDRRQLLKGAALGGAALLAPRALWTGAAWGAPAIFTNSLQVPPALDLRGGGSADLTMTAGVHDFQIGRGVADTFCYQSPGAAPTYLGPTIVAQSGTEVTLHVKNELGAHPLAANVDTELHGALASDADSPRASLHLHGGNTEPGSDGGPLDTVAVGGRSKQYRYANDQQSAGLWYHDHALGITRLNVYAGLAGGYLLRDENDPGDSSTGLPSGAYELPLILQDRLFTADGALDYPQGDGATWAPEMFGDVPVVNGVAWARQSVDRTRYRLRVYNGSNARVYALRFTVVGSNQNLPFHQIGTDGGLLNSPVRLTSLVLAPGERADLLVDFSALPAGTRVMLRNGARTPYPDGPRSMRRGGSPLPELMMFTTTTARPSTPALPTNLRSGTGVPVPRLGSKVTSSTRVRTMTMVEVMGDLQPMMALLNNRHFMSEEYAEPAQHVLQNSLEVWELVNATADAHPIHLHLVQFQVLGRQKFDVAGYAALAGDPMAPASPYPPPPASEFLRGGVRPPAPNEQGWKDTVLAMPGEVTRIVVPFGQPADCPPVASPRVWPTTNPGVSDYVWHCHILEHEDNDMMQSFRIR